MDVQLDVTDESMSPDSDDGMKKTARSIPALPEVVDRTMLPRNFKHLEQFFNSAENSVPGASALSHQSTSKGPSESLKNFREIPYFKFGKMDSSEEESHHSKDSYVDSEDSGLFKDGYEFGRKFRPISRDKVIREVKKWKRTASDCLEEINTFYKPRRLKQKQMFSLPLGLEANQNASPGLQPTANSSKSQSRATSQYNTEDEIDVRRNDEFMREVQRVLRAKKNPLTLEKRSLPEEYSRLIFKKTAHQRNRNRQTKSLALTEAEEPVSNQNTDPGAEGDASEKVEGILELSQMVLKNKVPTNSKMAHVRNETLRTIEEKNCPFHESSHDDEAARMGKEPGLGSSNERKIVSYDYDHENVRDQCGRVRSHSFFRNNGMDRLKKVESYLSSVPDVQIISPKLPEISSLTSENEQSLFDSLSREFIDSLANGTGSRSKITSNDRKLLTIIVKRYFVRGEISRIDELMSSTLNEHHEVPPFENVSEREEFILTKIIKKFLSRGMRDTLEDLIAWIYYKLDAEKAKRSHSMTDGIPSGGDVRGMVNAFNNLGKNASLDKIVSKLMREHEKENPGLNRKQRAAVKDMMKGLVVERFARMYLERTAPDVRSNSLCPLSTNVNNDVEIDSGLELFDVNGRNIGIEWKFTSPDGK